MSQCILKNVKKGRVKKMGKKLFDFCIGNPPYQVSNDSNNKQEPIYPYFYDAAEKLSDRYMLISPARFLFNAGLTPKDWNKKMLSDEHIKVEYYNQNAIELFPNTDIKGGVAIMYRDSQKELGPIEEFIPDENLRSISIKVQKNKPESIMSIMIGGRSALKFNDYCLEKYPSIASDRLRAIQKKNPKVKNLAANEEYELKSSTFDVLPYVFHEFPVNHEKCFRILGLKDGKRVRLYVEREFLSPRYEINNIDYYKVFIPKASGNGQLGETISSPEIGEKGDSSTPTFISLGRFESEVEAYNALKYIKTKFTRVLLGILKITQDIVPSKWKYVPLQDFTSESDIDWSKSIHEIDLQLYKKYGLDQEEINFIETNVKEMV